jgi:hypothetical protein
VTRWGNDPRPGDACRYAGINGCKRQYGDGTTIALDAAPPEVLFESYLIAQEDLCAARAARAWGRALEADGTNASVTSPAYIASMQAYPGHLEKWAGATLGLDALRALGRPCLAGTVHRALPPLREAPPRPVSAVMAVLGVREWPVALGPDPSCPLPAQCVGATPPTTAPTTADRAAAIAACTAMATDHYIRTAEIGCTLTASERDLALAASCRVHCQRAGLAHHPLAVWRPEVPP